MTSSIPFSTLKPLPTPLGFRFRAAAVVRAALEGIILLLVCATPWCYGCVHPGFEMLLLGGVALVLVLWGMRMILEGCLSWKKCPVTLCLAGLFLLGIWQITPLSPSVLARVSPGTSALYATLLPSQPELTDETGSTGRPGETISLYPEGTRIELIRLLAVFLLFAAVRNNVATPAGLRRLCVVALVNGGALSLFAVVQFMSSPHNRLYWTYDSLGQVFGPFICRNHFACYVNLCIGLGVGLLLGRESLFDRIAPERGGHPSWSGRWRYSRGGGLTLGDLLNDPATLWICALLILMVGAVFFSLSRGGMLALGGGAIACLLLRRSESRTGWRSGGVLVILVLAVLLIGWLGFGLVQERVATLWKGEAVQSRWPIWKRMAPLALQFPLWGTGLGTFTYTEGLRQETVKDIHIQLEHAHNDFLEILLEGGMVGLLLSVMATLLIFQLGYRAVRHGESRAARGLALGALMSFAILVIESLGDFSLHIPAVTLLATLVCAHVCGAGDSWRPAGEERIPADAGEYRLRLGGLAPLTGVAACVALGLALFGAGWRAHRIDRLQVAGIHAVEEKGNEGLQKQVECLERAVRLAPAKAEVRAELGEARVKLFEWMAKQHKQRRNLATFAGAVVAARCDWAAVLEWLSEGPAAEMVDRKEQKEEARKYLLPALRHFVTARDCCPLLASANLALATRGSILARSESYDKYLDRVKLVSGGDPEIWFLCGAQELLAKEPNKAWASWRRCLELSDTHLPEILTVAHRDLGPREILEFVTPNRPEVLFSAAMALYPESESREDRRLFLEKALHLLERNEALKPEDLRLKAMVHKALGQAEEAIQSYLKALARQPEQVDWRCELAQVFLDENKLEDARRELVVVLAQKPGHMQARDMMIVVAQALTGKK